MRVVILGAGASYGASRNGGTPCPLVDGIFQTAHRSGILADAYAAPWVEGVREKLDEIARKTGLPKYEGHLRALLDFVGEQFGVSEENLAEARIDCERLFALIEVQLLGHHGLLRWQKEDPQGPLSSDLLEMQMFLVLCGSLLCSTRDLVCEYHDSLVSWLRDGDVIISFNYDLLIDRSLRKSKRWHPSDGYGLQFHRVGKLKGRGASWSKPEGSSRRSKLLLLKPHGSLNWLYPRNSWETMLHLDLHGVALTPAEPVVYCLEDVNAQFEEDHPLYDWWAKHEHKQGKEIFDLHSLIVPPSFAKPYRDFEPLVGDLWAQALALLVGETEELYIIGFSLREDDLRAWWLLRTVALEAEKLKRCVLVDPSDDVFARATRVLTPRPVERGPRTLAEFAETLPGR